MANPTGAVVGTTDKQILTNKSIDGVTNTLTNIPLAAIPAHLSAVPTGVISMYGAAAAPTGYLLCDGASLSTTTYAALFAVIGYAYGGAGANFNVPNFASAFPRGNTPAVNGGAATATLTTTQLPSHTHTQDSHNHTQDAHSHTQAIFSGGATNANTRVSGQATTGAGVSTANLVLAAATATNQATTATNQATGGGAAFSILPPYIGVSFIIKV